jgi:hypothetical protein
VVIGDRPLAQLVPLYRDPRSDMPVTQFDMKHVEDAGLVKFDFLGLKTLSVLRKAVDLGKRGSPSISRCCRSMMRASIACSRLATRWACSSWNPKACAARWRR